MTKRTRNFLFTFFVFLFFIITPLAIFYAAGYKINFSWPIKINSFLQKTGMLVITTEPKNASIYLNDSTAKKLWDLILWRENNTILTPAKIKGLLPGEYEVRLELDGYWPWQKKLSIYPGMATIQENILLFKKDLPLQVLEMSFEEDEQSNWLSISPDKKSIACTNQKKLKIFDISTETISSWEISNQLKSDRDLLWSPDGKKIILQEKIYNIEKNEVINLSGIIYQNIFNVKWNKENSSQIYYQHGSNLNLFDLDKKTNSTLFSATGIQDYLVDNEKIISVANKNENTILESYSLTENKITNSISLPFSSEYKILPENKKYIHLYDTKHKILYLLNFEAFTPLKESINNVKKFVWVDENRLLYANDYEIWLMELGPDSLFEGGNKKTLLTRLSRSITNIAWHPDGGHILYSTADGIRVLDLDNKEKRVLTELIQLENIYNTAFLPENNLVYFCARLGNKEGIYKLEL